MAGGHSNTRFHASGPLPSCGAGKDVRQRETPRQVALLGVPLTPCTLTQGIGLIEEIIARRDPTLVTLANAHTLNHAYQDKAYKEVLKDAAVVLRDGTGVAWAMEKKGVDAGHNFVGTDFIPDFLKHTASRNHRVFLLGSKPGTSEKAAWKLQEMAPGVVVAGCHHGYFPFEDTERIIRRINRSNPSLLLVAMGNPTQELWISRHLDRLNVPVSIGVGALFDYLSGEVRRAPPWILDAGLEWVFRLALEPGRLWKRYLIGNCLFIMRVNRELHAERKRAMIEDATVC
jgi:N-acetylglucosaminyldiphosphoundecaprenol N-acetyl-beta-D-mannosaminyltransferase